MALKVIDHGEWEAYRPEVPPDWSIGSPLPIGFARRIGDGVDWYDFIRSDGQFYDGSVLATVLRDPSNDEWTVKAVYRDETALFPANHRLIEVLGISAEEDQPQRVLAWLTYHPETQTFSGVPSPPVPELVVSSSQAKIQLSRMKRGDTDLLAMTKKVVAASGDIELQTWFSDARTWRPSNQNVLKIGIAFDLTREEIQAAFEAASQIQE